MHRSGVEEDVTDGTLPQKYIFLGIGPHRAPRKNGDIHRQRGEIVVVRREDVAEGQQENREDFAEGQQENREDFADQQQDDRQDFVEEER